MHQDQGRVDGGQLEAAGVDGSVGADRAAGRAAAAVDPETPAGRSVRPLGVGLPADRRTPAVGRRLGPVGWWVESVHGRSLPQIPQQDLPSDPLLANSLTDQRPGAPDVTENLRKVSPCPRPLIRPPAIRVPATTRSPGGLHVHRHQHQLPRPQFRCLVHRTARVIHRNRAVPELWPTVTSQRRSWTRWWSVSDWARL